ncbi:hypothetical protein L599_004400000020 [Luteimonas sp. J16]|jgi:hypothetical protein|uniref:hypothetical protein n=1 Tax=unclassified Luteimonas TaxID=2629088 RepID=UPI00047C8210|nr:MULTISPECIES: hypothetical protein [unclassified Luteimonas]TWG89409.1 hypothetical protein L599_004400000020 [Luteimonas sp. J16]
MPLYKDINGDSGVQSYEIGDGSIIVQFERGGSYLYTNASAGADHIAEMQRLAQIGDGLNAYINKYVRKNYAQKLA